MLQLTELQKKILDFVAQNPGSQSSQMAGLFSVNKTTIQRNLKALIDNKQISVSGAGRSLSYHISDYNKIFEEIDTDNYFAISYQQREIKEKFNFDIFNLLENDLFTGEEVEKIESLHKDFIKNFSKYDSQTLINKEFERIMIEFSWKSSRIEGNTYSLLSTEVLLKENIPGKGKSKEETQMILNHKNAFNEAMQNKQRFLKLDYYDVEYIHTILTKNLGVAKNVRKIGVGITGTKYRPLDTDFQIKEALHNMVELINKKELFFEKAFLAMILIPYIQAFEDGNKRTARMFSNAILLAHHSIPLSYRIVEVEEYKKACLLFYELNNISYFKKIFIDQFEDAVKNYFRV